MHKYLNESQNYFKALGDEIDQWTMNVKQFSHKEGDAKYRMLNCEVLRNMEKEESNED